MHPRQKPNLVLSGFSDDRNIMAIMFAGGGFRQLRVQSSEMTTFTAWQMVVQPELFLNPPPQEQVAALFGDIWSQPRSEQKRCARDAISLARTGKFSSS